ncbi:MAG: YceI family protein [Ferrovum sp.]|nr:YceI family protein [Ferrovum sp.]NDU86801.1 YceI family protein [Ferrovum sp.]
MMKLKEISLISGFVSALLMSPAFAQWNLTNDQSNLNFISIKKNNIAEVHQFKKMAGEVSDQGKIHLTIDLASVNTNIDIRNERLKTLLFNVAQFPQAEFTGTLDMSSIADMKAGDHKTIAVQGQLELHGVTQPVKTDLDIVRLNNDQIQVTTHMPLIVNADRYGMADGIGKLMEVAGLPMISSAVPVTFDLVFSR